MPTFDQGCSSRLLGPATGLRPMSIMLELVENRAGLMLEQVFWLIQNVSTPSFDHAALTFCCERPAVANNLRTGAGGYR